MKTFTLTPTHADALLDSQLVMAWQMLGLIPKKVPYF